MYIYTYIHAYIHIHTYIYSKQGILQSSSPAVPPRGHGQWRTRRLVNVNTRTPPICSRNGATTLYIASRQIWQFRLCAPWWCAGNSAGPPGLGVCSRCDVAYLCVCDMTRHTATSATWLDTLQHTATHCNTLQHTATHCSALQRSATLCSTLRHTQHYMTQFQLETAQGRPTLAFAPGVTWCSVRNYCNTMQRTATHCNSYSAGNCVGPPGVCICSRRITVLFTYIYISACVHLYLSDFWEFLVSRCVEWARCESDISTMLSNERERERERKMQMYMCIYLTFENFSFLVASNERGARVIYLPS